MDLNVEFTVSPWGSSSFLSCCVVGSFSIWYGLTINELSECSIMLSGRQNLRPLIIRDSTEAVGFHGLTYVARRRSWYLIFKKLVWSTS